MDDIRKFARLDHEYDENEDSWLQEARANEASRTAVSVAL